MWSVGVTSEAETTVQATHSGGYVKKSVIMNTYEYGGLNFLDFSSLNNTFKVNWISQFLCNPSSIWNFIPNYLFSK